jgi:hypothetical protein
VVVLVCTFAFVLCMSISVLCHVKRIGRKNEATYGPL